MIGTLVFIALVLIVLRVAFPANFAGFVADLGAWWNSSLLRRIAGGVFWFVLVALCLVILTSGFHLGQY
jgi:hypothetical protein